MAKLPQVSRDLALTPQVQSSVSGSDVAQANRPAKVYADPRTAYTAIAEAAGEIGAAFMDRAQQYERATAAARMAEESQKIRNAAQQMSIDANGNAQGFASAWDEFSKARLADIPGKLRPGIQTELAQVGGDAFRGIREQRYSTDITKSKRVLLDEIAFQDDTLAALSRGGQAGSPAFAAASAKQRDLYNELSNNPAFGYSADEADLELKRKASRYMAEGFIGHALTTYRTGGMAASAKEADQLLTDPNLALTPDERRQYHALYTQQLSTEDAGRKAMLDDAKKVSSALQARIKADPRLVDDPSVDQSIMTLARLGGTQEAIDLMHARAQARQLRGFKNLSDPEQVAAYQNLGKGGGTLDQAREAIAAIESRGSGDYGAKGVLTGGDHAYGRYQVMGNNIASWTKAALGHALTRDQFLADPTAQDAVFNHVFGGYVKQYGMAGAASMWFTGRPGATGGPDALGTSPTAYVRRFMAALGAGDYNPATDAEAVTAMRKEVTDDFTRNLTALQEGLTKGLPPAQADLELLANQVAIVDDAEARDKLATFLKQYEGGALLANVPADQQDALLNRLRAGLTHDGQDGMTVAGQAYFRGVGDQKADFQRRLAADPLLLEMDTSGQAPAPLDFSDPVKFQAGIAERAHLARQTEARWHVAGVPALTKNEQAAVAATWQKADLNQRLGLVASFVGSINNRDTLMATLATFADKAETSSLAMAGALAVTNPETGSAVLRGTEILKVNQKFAFEPSDADYVKARDSYFPPTVAVPGSEAAWQAHLDAARAIYADTMSRKGNTSGAFDEATWKQAIDTVTGGLVTFNDQKTFAPRPGMDQATFNNVMAALPESALAGAAMPGSGTPITKRFLLGTAKLHGVGDGRYAIAIGDTGSYAMRVARSPGEAGIGGPFELDLRPYLDVVAQPGSGGIVGGLQRTMRGFTSSSLPSGEGYRYFIPPGRQR